MAIRGAQEITALSPEEIADCQIYAVHENFPHFGLSAKICDINTVPEPFRKRLIDAVSLALPYGNPAVVGAIAREVGRWIDLVKSRTVSPDLREYLNPRISCEESQ